MIELPHNDQNPENRETNSCEKSFHEEYQEFLKYKDNQIEKKKRGVKGQLFAIVVILLIASFISGMVFENQSGYMNRLMTPADESAFVLEQEQPSVQYTNSTSVSPVVDIAEAALPSIVAIESVGVYTDVLGSSQMAEGTGSGIIISSDGYIVTNNHVVEGTTSLTVILQDQTEYEATIVGTDELSDLAVVKINKDNLPAATLGDSSTLQVGELVVALGSPVGINFAGSVTSGIVSGLNRQIYLGDKTMNLIQTDAAINPGNSGGALVNSDAQVIGINVLKLAEEEVEGMSFSIPINEAKPIIEELINTGKISRPYLGILASDISEEDAEAYDVPRGVLIQEVQANTGAARAGIKRGDIVTHIDDTRITSMDELTDLILKKNVGDDITLTVEREEQVLTIYAVLGER